MIKVLDFKLASNRTDLAYTLKASQPMIELVRTLLEDNYKALVCYASIVAGIVVSRHGEV